MARWPKPAPAKPAAKSSSTDSSNGADKAAKAEAPASSDKKRGKKRSRSEVDEEGGAAVCVSDHTLSLSVVHCPDPIGTLFAATCWCWCACLNNQVVVEVLAVVQELGLVQLRRRRNRFG